MTTKIHPFCHADKCTNDGTCRILGEWYCSDHAQRSVLTCSDDSDDHDTASFDSFMTGVRELIETKAAAKGYNEHGAETNELMAFTNRFFPGHAPGEVLYKLIRYQSKKNPEDLLKAAAWIYLMWLSQ